MASPPSSSGLALPRQRPGGLKLALPGQSSRKSSVAPSSAHPLRQTSFPPPDSLEAQHRLAEDADLNAQFSPNDGDSIDDFSDSEITSAISGPASTDAFTKKRKRGEKRPRGRPPTKQNARQGSASVLNGDDGRSAKRGGTAGAQSVANGEAEEEDDDEDDEGAAQADKEGYGITAQDLEKENQRRYLFREAVIPDHQDRYDHFVKVKLRTGDVRKLVNATLSQSVPPNVMTVVGAYTKLFAGMLIESAREVQAEWLASQPKRPDDEENQAYKRLRMMRAESEEADDDEEDEEDDIEVAETDGRADGEGKKLENGDAKKEGVSPAKHDGLPDGDPLPAEEGSPNHARAVSDGTQPHSSSTTNEETNGQPKDRPNGDTKEEKKDDEDDIYDFRTAQPGAWGLSKYIDECDRGPLLPDHLREALRRYKKSRAGGSVGFTAISLDRPEVAAPRLGGRRLFR
ncbi:hypothetical protein DOTSEDRAFT_35311 [Dothistroma septosporum NZE10]|uniref:TAFII28-like protein domain-containing protein n=1 Tax=Dothistroma septosporum (strain NZE10 / CBS 128990) TaxID=675120 RepID=M2YLR5_DOTSN|nr:hypothetical protein DOTSEDRAFT_35311 [Dothistroma septosporum NZE10]